MPAQAALRRLLGKSVHGQGAGSTPRCKMRIEEPPCTATQGTRSTFDCKVMHLLTKSGAARSVRTTYGASEQRFLSKGFSDCCGLVHTGSRLIAGTTSMTCTKDDHAPKIRDLRPWLRLDIANPNSEIEPR